MRSKDESKMEKIVEFINQVYFATYSVPTIKQIADSMGMSCSSVVYYLRDMEVKGMVTLNEGWRGVRTTKITKTLDDLQRIPVVGEIACGTPMFAEENIEYYLTISAEFLGTGKYFALKAKGDSMINANIYNGDFVIVRQQNTANEGQIIVALIDYETTLKRYYIDRVNQKVILHPENDDMEDMFFDNVEIQGIVVKVIKDVK